MNEEETIGEKMVKSYRTHYPRTKPIEVCFIIGKNFHSDNGVSSVRMGFSGTGVEHVGFNRK